MRAATSSGGGGKRRFLASRVPDVLVVSELRGWEEGGWWRLWELADGLGMIALPPVLSARGRGNHLAVLIRPETVRVYAYDPDACRGAFYHGLARLVVYLKDAPQRVTILGTHLCFLGGEERLAEARWLTGYADDYEGNGQRVFLAGDLNTIGLHDEEPDWSKIPRNLRSRHCLTNTDGSFGATDRRAIGHLTAAGFADPYELLDRPPQRTAGYWGSEELLNHRSDFILANRLAAPVVLYVLDITVHDTEVTRGLSDHLPVEATVATTPRTERGTR
ncbi:endonuclease/exonuclease/phosphatase family protein [Streptomyces sp. URMC 127]|uniref:endonuclease/exonuclease/phosphatase family protein n=1 Tax=Streptomyces sp. URMC 127 TaxID=3423402 RepID=UPI003F19601A